MDNLRDQARRSGFEHRVVFCGKIEYDDVPAYLKLADIFVTASETEVHPLSLIEAMAAALPALGIDSPGVGDTIVDGENGFLSGSDLAAFTAKMMRLVMEPATRRRMAERALEASRLYDINRTAALVLAEYEQLVARSEQRLRRWSGLGQRLRRLLP
jgi:glycosyltransferase involved in cell wall biosynthesis